LKDESANEEIAAHAAVKNAVHTETLSLRHKLIDLEAHYENRMNVYQESAHEKITELEIARREAVLKVEETTTEAVQGMKEVLGQKYELRARLEAAERSLTSPQLPEQFRPISLPVSTIEKITQTKDEVDLINLLVYNLNEKRSQEAAGYVALQMLQPSEAKTKVADAVELPAGFGPRPDTNDIAVEVADEKDLGVL
jgi:hypothetical protein